jgi:acetyltransferase
MRTWPIHPYPIDLVGEHVLPDGTRLAVRPIRPEDAALEREFVDGLSERSRYLRFMMILKSITPQMVSRFTQIDYDREMALIAVAPTDEGERRVAVARYVTYRDGRGCEFAIVVADEWHNKGMIDLSRGLGFEEHPIPEDSSLLGVSLRL